MLKMNFRERYFDRSSIATARVASDASADPIAPGAPSDRSASCP